MTETPWRTTVILPKSSVDALKELGERHDRSLAGELRYAVKVYIEIVQRADRRNGGPPPGRRPAGPAT